jgi:CBS domain-containing protein
MERKIKVRDIMTQDVIFVTAETQVPDIARLLYKFNISGVPVMDNNRIVGIVTEEDLIIRTAIIETPHVFSLFDSVFYFGNKKEFERELSRTLATKASELMTDHVMTINQDAPVEELATLMMKKDINPVPVVNDAGELCGIVSRSDIVRLLALAEDDEKEQESIS